MTARVDVPPISASILRFFRGIVRGYFRRSFHAVRVRGLKRFAGFANSLEPLIVYANHGSWWDPMVAILLADKTMRGRRHYAPMDEQALKRYPILRRLGIFGVEMHLARGAVRFLRMGEAMLAAGGVVWVTPQGRFVDARTRPLDFRPGMAALAARAAKAQGGCWVLPLAIEYTFWDERTPECLLSFGEPVRVTSGTSAGELAGVFEEALATTLDELRATAMARDPRALQTLMAGRVGTGGFYGLGQRIKALVTRSTYRPEHTAAGKAEP